MMLQEYVAVVGKGFISDWVKKKIIGKVDVLAETSMMFRS